MTLIYEHDLTVLKTYLHTNVNCLDQGFPKSEHYRRDRKHCHDVFLVGNYVHEGIGEVLHSGQTQLSL